MTEEKTKTFFGKIGAICTAIYICVLIFFIIYYWQHFRPMKPNEWGDFFAGTLGPVALIWVVLGFFLQGKELGHSVHALNLQAKELKNSVEQQKAIVDLTREQIDLNITSKHQQERITEEKNLPDMSVRLEFPRRQQLKMQKEIHIHNLGATATSVEAVLILNKKLVSGLDLGVLKANDTTTLGQSISIMDGDYELKIVSKSKDGSSRIQDFKVSIYGIHETNCDPKRFKSNLQ